MPREVSDIKQFIEICRRKDAKCKPLSHDSVEYQLRERERGMDGGIADSWDYCSRTHKAQRPPDQIQGPMSPLFVHVGVEGFGKGG